MNASAIVKRFAGQSNTIAIPRALIEMTGDYVSAAVLSQVIYWADKMGGEFYKTDEDFCSELCVSPYQLRQARAKLEEFGVKTVRKGVPAKMHYGFDEEAFNNKLLSFFTTVPEETKEQVSEETSQLIQKTTTVDYTEENPPIIPPQEKADKEKKEGPAEQSESFTLARQSANGSLEPKKTSELRNEDFSAAAFAEAYNRLKPDAWAKCGKLNSERRRKINKFLRENAEAETILENAMRYVSQDKWWCDKNISFDTLFTKNHLLEWHEKQVSQGFFGGMSEADRKLARNAERMYNALKGMAA